MISCVRFALFTLMPLLMGCMSNHLSIQTDFLNRTNLASYYIGTPDPLQQYPLIGQRLLIQWCFPYKYFAYDDLHLRITIRFGDRSEIRKAIAIRERSGYYNYILAEQEFCEKEGIVSYKVQLIGCNQIIEEWQHQLWAELLHIGENE